MLQMTYKYPFYFYLLLWLISFGCSKNNSSQFAIDYESIERTEVKIITDTSEEDGYISGQLRDLVLMEDGTMLVADWGNITIEQFSKEGRHIQTVAEQGRGPGEISSFILLFEGTGDTLLVRHRGMYNQIDYYSPNNENGFYTYDESRMFHSTGERYIQFLHAISDDTFLATARKNVPMVYFQTEEMRNYDLVPVAIVDSEEKILLDSLHLLKTPNPETDFFEGGMDVIGMPAYQYQDRLEQVSAEQYLIARPDSSALYIMNNETHELDYKIDLDVKPRSVGKNDLDFSLRGKDREVRNRLEVRIPEYKPSFLNVWTSDNYTLLHTDTREEGKEMVVLNMNGEPHSHFFLSEYDNIRYFREDKIYTLHQNPETGHSIRIYQIDF